MKPPYNADSIEYALTQHQERGAVNFFMHQDRKRLSVFLPGMRDQEVLTLAQAYALCLGLRAAESHYSQHPEKARPIE